MKNNETEITEIIPISRKIGKKEVLNAVRTTQNKENLLGSGASGDVYIFRKKYVVKRTHKNFNKEVKALINLDNAIKEGLDIGNSQRGICAFKTNEDDVQGYIVSTYVEGRNVFNLPDIYMTQKHFDNIFDLLLKMDLGTIQKNNLEILYIFLHYDLSPINLLLTDKEANLVDFETLEKENLDIYFFKRQIYSCKHNIYDDTVTFPCNMRLFEICFLWLYFVHLTHSCGEANNQHCEDYSIEKRKKVGEIFNKYLLAKSKYLQKQSELHFKIANHQGLGRELLKRVSKEESIHSKLISFDGINIPDDIRFSEMYKIQLANFYFQVEVRSTGTKAGFNIEQVIDYRKEKEEFYVKQLENSKKQNDKDRILYYTNCIKFVNKFIDISNFEIKDKSIPICKHIPTLDEMIL